MNIIETNIPEVLLLEPKVHGDSRGFFMESYNKQKFADLGIHLNFVQDNHSLSQPAGTLRGLHFQTNPKAQSKLVRVTKGAIYDVAVDIRRNSPTYGKSVSAILTEENKRQLLVPKGFAHGFCTLVENTEVQYKVDEYYSPENDSGVYFNDPELQIDWPVKEPVLSDKDKVHPLLKDSDHNFTY